MEKIGIIEKNDVRKGREKTKGRGRREKRKGRRERGEGRREEERRNVKGTERAVIKGKVGFRGGRHTLNDREIGVVVGEIFDNTGLWGRC